MPVSDNIGEQFQREWVQFHSGRQPFGSMLRTDRTLPCIRFHALPASKRYAENGEERSIILARANQLAEDVLRSDVPSWIIHLVGKHKETYGELAGSYAVDDEIVWRYAVTKAQWAKGAFDLLLSAIAEDERRAIWMNRQTGGIFAPYDGGFDIFPPSLDEVELLRDRYADWLSDHPEGL